MYLSWSRWVHSWSHSVGPPETWSEEKRAATTAGILVRCLISQSLLIMPAGGPSAPGSLCFFSMTEILEKSGNAKVFIGGCSAWRWADIIWWISGQPTNAIRLTGGVLNSSGYSSISLCCGSHRIREIPHRETEIADNGGIKPRFSKHWLGIGDRVSIRVS